LESTHYEKTCLECGEERGGADLTTSIALLYTMRGRMELQVGVWTCPNGHVVLYDGAHDGLFAMGAETIYVRVFMDSVLGVCVIARATMAAAAEYLTSVLRNTGAYAEMEFGQARQLVSDACGEFSETLVVPDVVFTCDKCGADEERDGQFQCVLSDGQILAVLQDHIVKMLRPGMDAPRADMAITYACAVRNATARAVIRHRIRAGATDDVALTADEACKFRVFSAARHLGRPAAPPTPTETSRGRRPRATAENALMWATAEVFFKFFSVPGLGQAAPAAADAAAGAVAAGDAAGVEENDDQLSEDEGGGMADLAPESGGSSDADVASSTDYSDEALQQPGAGSSDDSVVGGDEGLPPPPLLAEWYGQDTVGSQAAAASSAPEGAAQVADNGQGGSGADGFIPNLEPNLSALQLEVPSPGGTGPSETPATQTASPPPINGGAEVVVPAPADAGPIAFESERARVPRTSDAWRVPLSSVDEQATSDHPVAVEPADPASPLTLHALNATNDALEAPTRSRLIPLVEVHGIPISSANVKNLLPGQWLDDEPINGMVKLLEKRNEATVAANPEAPKFHLFNTFFFHRLWYMGENSYDMVRRWTKKVDVFACAKIFIPINIMNSHWILVMVETGPSVIHVYDSLGERYPMVDSSIKRWLHDEAEDKGKGQREWSSDYPRCPQQENSDDCGVFTVKMMDYLALGLDLAEMTKSTAYYRRRIAAELLSVRVGGSG